MTENLISVETEQRLLTIAVEINTIREQTRTTVLTAACEIGKRLIEAKNNLPYGMWGEWLSNNVDCSERQAQQLMALYDEYGGDARALNRLSVSQAVALLAAPDEVREELIESGAAEDMSVRELKAEIARQKQELESRQVRIDELTAEAGAADTRAGDAERDAREAKRLQKQAEKEAKEAKTSLRAAMDVKAKAQEERDAVRKELEELRAAPVEQVELVPPEVEAELDNLRERVRTAPDAPTILARAAYDRGVAEFRRAKEQLLQIEPPEAAKYARAFAEGLRRLAKDMEEVATWEN